MSKPILSQEEAYAFVKKIVDGISTADIKSISEHYDENSIVHFGEVNLTYADIIKRTHYIQENYIDLRHILLNAICFDNFIVANDLQFYQNKKNKQINRVDLTLVYRLTSTLKIAEAWLMSNVDYNYKADIHEDDELLNVQQGLARTSRQNILNDFKYTINQRLKEDYPNITFTDREMETLFYTLVGYTSKEVGKQLDLSHRTIESYLDVIKEKLGCNSKSEIRTALIPGGIWL